MFSCEFCEISKNTFFRKHLRATASACRINGSESTFLILLGITATACFYLVKNIFYLIFDVFVHAML